MKIWLYFRTSNRSLRALVIQTLWLAAGKWMTIRTRYNLVSRVMWSARFWIQILTRVPSRHHGLLRKCLKKRTRSKARYSRGRKLNRSWCHSKWISNHQQNRMKKFDTIWLWIYNGFKCYKASSLTSVNWISKTTKNLFLRIHSRKHESRSELKTCRSIESRIDGTLNKSSNKVMKT